MSSQCGRSEVWAQCSSADSCAQSLTGLKSRRQLFWRLWGRICFCVYSDCWPNSVSCDWFLCWLLDRGQSQSVKSPTFPDTWPAWSSVSQTFTYASSLLPSMASLLNLFCLPLSFLRAHIFTSSRYFIQDNFLILKSFYPKVRIITLILSVKSLLLYSQGPRH